MENQNKQKLGAPDYFLVYIATIALILAGVGLKRNWHLTKVALTSTDWLGVGVLFAIVGCFISAYWKRNYIAKIIQTKGASIILNLLLNIFSWLLILSILIAAEAFNRKEVILNSLNKDILIVAGLGAVWCLFTLFYDLGWIKKLISVVESKLKEAIDK